MRIKRITWQHRNDYRAVMVCEHCRHTQTDPCGYADAFYQERVIPAMYCGGCGKNSDGATRPIEATSSATRAA